MAKRAGGYLYVCSFGVVNCKICCTEDQREMRRARARELRRMRAEAFRFRNSPRLVIVVPKVPTPSAPAPQMTIERARRIAEEDTRYGDTFVFTDLLYGNHRSAPVVTPMSPDLKPQDIYMSTDSRDRYMPERKQ